jgi:hypothetical protein
MRAADLPGCAAEQRDDPPVAAGYGDIGEAGAAGQRDFGRLGGQGLALLAGAEIADRVVLGDGDAVVGIAGEGEGAVGEREDEPAMADAVAVQMMRRDRSWTCARCPDRLRRG